MNYKELVNKAYSKYVKDWCESRGYYPGEIDPEFGINGECYVCINEFEKNEFQDEEYMERLLANAEYVIELINSIPTTLEASKDSFFLFLRLS